MGYIYHSLYRAYLPAQVGGKELQAFLMEIEQRKDLEKSGTETALNIYSSQREQFEGTHLSTWTWSEVAMALAMPVRTTSLSLPSASRNRVKEVLTVLLPTGNRQQVLTQLTIHTEQCAGQREPCLEGSQLISIRDIVRM